MHPGDRRKRWKKSHQVTGTIHLLLGVGFLMLTKGDAGLIIVAFFGFMALLEFRDARYGWRLRYDIPKRAQRRHYAFDK